MLVAYDSQLVEVIDEYNAIIIIDKKTKKVLARIYLHF